MPLVVRSSSERASDRAAARARGEELLLVVHDAQIERPYLHRRGQQKGIRCWSCARRSGEHACRGACNGRGNAAGPVQLK